MHKKSNQSLYLSFIQWIFIIYLSFIHSFMSTNSGKSSLMTKFKEQYNNLDKSIQIYSKWFCYSKNKPYGSYWSHNTNNSIMFIFQCLK